MRSCCLCVKARSSNYPQPESGFMTSLKRLFPWACIHQKHWNMNMWHWPTTTEPHSEIINHLTAVRSCAGNPAPCTLDPSTNHPPTHPTEPTHPRGTSTPQWHWLPQQDDERCHTTKTAQEEPKQRDRELTATTWPQNAPDPRLIELHPGKKCDPWSAVGLVRLFVWAWTWA